MVVHMNSAKPLRVYKGFLIFLGQQVHACLSAASRAEAVRIINATCGPGTVSDGLLRDYWTESGNDVQVALCSAQPKTLFVTANTGYLENNAWLLYAEGLNRIRENNKVKHGY